MAGHDRRDPGFHGGPERGEVHCLEVFAGGRDGGEPVVAVGPGAAVSGEVLRGRQRASRLDAAQEGGAEPGHQLRVRPVGARADDRALRAPQHIEHRGEHQVDADRARLAGHDAALALQRLEVGGGGGLHRRGEAGAAGGPHRRSPLVVGPDQERQRRHALERRGHLAGAARGPGEHHRAPDPPRLGKGEERPPLGIAFVAELRRRPRRQHLADLRFEVEPREHLPRDLGRLRLPGRRGRTPHSGYGYGTAQHRANTLATVPSNRSPILQQRWPVLVCSTLVILPIRTRTSSRRHHPLLKSTRSILHRVADHLFVLRR